MAQTIQAIQRLWFEPLYGPEIDGFWLDTGDDLVFGRGSNCDIQLHEATISRQHGRFKSNESGCFVIDLGSRLGTKVNDVACDKDVPIPISTGDLIQVGPWIFRTSIRQGAPVAMPTLDDTSESESRVQRMTWSDVGALAQHRLSLLIDCAANINKATDISKLGSLLVKSAVQGTGFQRAAMLLPSKQDGEIEVMAFLDGESRDASGTVFSRSLLEAAAKGDVACMLCGQTGEYGQSIADLNIHSAICCGVRVDDILIAYLYLDAREQERQVQTDAAGFCQALCQMAGLAYANLRRMEMQIRQTRLEQDLAAAREAQRLMVPSDLSKGDKFGWSHIFRPGREASGDLLDIIPLSETRMALVVGDVSGKGVGAAILMAAAQAFIHSRLSDGCTPSAAVSSVNKFVTKRSAMNRFLSLWVGIFDAETMELLYVDAGHGHWTIRRADGITQAPPIPGGLLVWIDETEEYRDATLPINVGDRVILFTDGIVEQQTDTDEQFGVERVYDLVSKSSSPEQDVKSLLKAVMEWAGRTSLDDDTTIVSLGLV